MDEEGNNFSNLNYITFEILLNLHLTFFIFIAISIMIRFYGFSEVTIKTK